MPNGRRILIVKHWHYLDEEKHPNTKYCYINVYKVAHTRPFRWWRWIEFPDGSWEWAP